jgi:uncharacterized SAM-binding protein YcdF (DUF218 family)
MLVLGAAFVSTISSTTRIALFILVLVAVALILAGAAIAAYTWRQQHKAQSARINGALLESEHP